MELCTGREGRGEGRDEGLLLSISLSSSHFLKSGQRNQKRSVLSGISFVRRLKGAALFFRLQIQVLDVSEFCSTDFTWRKTLAS